MQKLFLENGSSNIKVTKVHSFLKQYFVQSSVDLIWGYFQLMSAKVQIKDQLKVSQICEWGKHCL